MHVAQPLCPCSAAGLDEFKQSGSCFPLSALQELARSWNRTRGKAPGAARIDENSQDPAHLRSELTRLVAGGKNKEVRWVQELGGASQNPVAGRMIMPVKPKAWNDNPNQWLNNYDIQHVLNRFEGDAKYPYKLLGVFPIDFSGKDSGGNVLYPEMHDFQLSRYAGKYPFMGLITNLDTHDGPGTHWTSSFIVIDPKMKCFGAYYYDSTFTSRTDLRRVPESIRRFFKVLKKQAEALPEARALNAKFKNVFYKLSHQRGNTECGMFSIFYQVHWLNSIIKNADTVHKDIIRLKITDTQVAKLRDFFFAPV